MTMRSHPACLDGRFRQRPGQGIGAKHALVRPNFLVASGHVGHNGCYPGAGVLPDVACDPVVVWPAGHFEGSVEDFENAGIRQKLLPENGWNKVQGGRHLHFEERLEFCDQCGEGDVVGNFQRWLLIESEDPSLLQGMSKFDIVAVEQRRAGLFPGLNLFISTGEDERDGVSQDHP